MSEYTSISRVEQLENLQKSAFATPSELAKHILPLLEQRKLIALAIVRPDNHLSDDNLRDLESAIQYCNSNILKVLAIQ